MRNLYFILSLSVVMLFGCKKSDSGGTASSNSSVSFKVNGTAVSVQGDYNTQANAAGAAFVFSPAYNLALAHYRFTSTASGGTLLGFTVIANQFATGTYIAPVDDQGISAVYGGVLQFGGKQYASGINGDPALTMQVVVTKYSGDRADGTFSGKVAQITGTDNQGNAVYEYVTITEGSFKNVLVKKQ